MGVKEVEAADGVRPGGETVPDSAEVLELGGGEEGAVCDGEVGGAGVGVFEGDEQAAMGKEGGEGGDAVRVDCFPVYAVVVRDAVADEFGVRFAPFLCLLVSGFVIMVLRGHEHRRSRTIARMTAM